VGENPRMFYYKKNAFSLSPALSRWERESRYSRQRRGVRFFAPLWKAPKSGGDSRTPRRGRDKQARLAEWALGLG